MKKILILLGSYYIVILLSDFLFFNNGIVRATQIFYWYIYTFLLGISLFNLIRTRFPNSYGFSKLFGTIGLFSVSWWLSLINIPAYISPSLHMIFNFLVIIGIFKGDKSIFNEICDDKKILYQELFIFFVFVITLIGSSFHPSLFWGEKPMDLTFLNYYIRASDYPHTDPWFSGHQTRYYYFGYFIFAGLSKMSSLAGNISYFVSLSTVYAFFTGSLLSLFFSLRKRGYFPYIATTIVLFGSNLKSYQLFFSDSLSIESFWSISRVFEKGYFAEFPLWSLLFADLHPHVMSYPVGIGILYLLFEYLIKSRWSWKEHLFLGYCLGVLCVINLWDYLYFLPTSMVVMGLALLRKGGGRWFHKVGLFSLSCVSSIFFFAPLTLLFLRGSNNGGIGLGLKHFNNFSGIFNHYGLIWSLWIILLIYLFSNFKKFKGYIKSFEFFPLPLSVFFVPLFIEVIKVNDEINTTFKFYTTHWVVSLVLGLVVLQTLMRNFEIKKKSIFSFLVLAFFITPSPLLFMSIKNFNPFGVKLPKLDGSVHLSRYIPSDFKLIEFVNDHIEGTPTVLEQYGKSFDHDSARISTFTGLPSFLGWDNHVKIRGALPSDIDRRKRMIKSVYSTPDVLSAYNALKNNKIDYIVVGPKERSIYSKNSLEKFDNYTEFFDKIFKYQMSSLYRIK